ncbi:NTH [Hepatospora eriocheir]|uniref:NTH n=1 Tax=Hepatospora eriocheir TaxID=1081669 RepID=A0A1X0QCP2_9MICR|nr:NTH [Hepatospora eriocheir]
MNFKEMFNLIKNQRNELIAPVDKYGCKAIGNNSYKIFIALLLSSQTRDIVTYTAVTNLTKLVKETFTPVNLLKYDHIDIHECIKQVGYHNKKLKYLIDSSKKLTKINDKDFNELIKLPGFGKKMAYLYLSNAHDIHEGIGVDLHVHRIVNRILNTKMTIEKVRKFLEGIFNKEDFNEVNRILVGFGQLICLKKKPKCNECCLKEKCKFNTEF